MSKPIIAITMGDPSGVGPEVILKALSSDTVRDKCFPVVIGDFQVLEKTLQDTGVIDCNRKLEKLSSVEKASDCMAQIPVLDLSNVDINSFEYGKIKSEYGKAAGEYIEKAIQLTLGNKADAIVTAPIQKEAFKLAGFPYPGHTEMLKALTNTKNVTLMLMLDHFRVVHVTLHASLKNAIDNLSIDSIYETILVANKGCNSLGITNPKIGVCGLNPHAGEGGLFGDEEERLIKPAIQKAAQEGIDVEGPFSSDGIFSMLKGKRFDIVVSMYHDQGGIPMKLLAFSWDNEKNQWKSIRGVNVTLGLPIIRTSVAHGTAFELAGKGISSPDSLLDAIDVACQMVKVKKVLV